MNPATKRDCGCARRRQKIKRFLDVRIFRRRRDPIATGIAAAGVGFVFNAFTTKHTAAGSGSETIPVGATSLTITVWGGGGGGRGGDGTGKGGSSGGRVTHTVAIASSDWGGTISWTVGAHGTGGATTPANGTTGATSSVTSSGLSFTDLNLQAGGGSGGTTSNGTGGTASGGNVSNTAGTGATTGTGADAVGFAGTGGVFGQYDCGGCGNVLAGVGASHGAGGGDGDQSRNINTFCSGSCGAGTNPANPGGDGSDGEVDFAWS